MSRLGAIVRLSLCRLPGHGLETPADRDAAEHRTPALAIEFAAAVVAGQGEFPAPPGDRQAIADVSDEWPLVHAVAVPEGVAFEGDVSQHPARVGRQDQVPGPATVAVQCPGGCGVFSCRPTWPA